MPELSCAWRAWGGGGEKKKEGEWGRGEKIWRALTGSWRLRIKLLKKTLAAPGMNANLCTSFRGVNCVRIKEREQR